MGWLGTVTALVQELAAVASRAMARYWGDQTRDEARLQKEAEHAYAEKLAALARGDMAAANQWQSRYDELHDEARAKSP